MAEKSKSSMMKSGSKPSTAVQNPAVQNPATLPPEVKTVPPQGAEIKAKTQDSPVISMPSLPESRKFIEIKPAKGEGKYKTLAEAYKASLKISPATEVPEFLPTGSVMLDLLMGGGVPRGNILQVYSDPGMGKSTTAAVICRTICLAGGNCLYVDAENSLNPVQIQVFQLEEFHGTSFFHHACKTFEEADEVLVNYLNCEQKIDFIVVDSITQLIPEKLKHMPVGSIEPGLLARWQGSFINKFRSFVYCHRSAMLLINQLRTRIKFTGNGSYKAPAGGITLQYSVDINISLQKEEDILDADGITLGYDIIAKAEKNRYARPFFPYHLSIIFGKGISESRAIAKLAIAKEIVKHNGGGYYNHRENKIRGAEEVYAYCERNLQILVEDLKAAGYI